MNSLRLVLGGLLFSALAACGDSVTDYCDAWVECEEGNDKDHDACIAELDGNSRVADAYGCGDEWNKRMDCRAEYSFCENNRYSSRDACDSERDKLKVCIDAASATD